MATKKKSDITSPIENLYKVIPIHANGVYITIMLGSVRLTFTEHSIDLKKDFPVGAVAYSTGDFLAIADAIAMAAQQLRPKQAPNGNAEANGDEMVH